MVDKFDKKTRSRVMAAVKNKNTKPELNVRKALFAKGLRYRLHVKKLPGNPDLVLQKYKAAIFIHGCFWHNHTCKQGALPTSNIPFWKEKLQKNAEQDRRNIILLEAVGWRVNVIWGCSLSHNQFASRDSITALVRWIKER